MAEKTPKQIREEIRANARKTLESKVFQGILGSNQVKSNPFLYGQLGVQGGEEAYPAFMVSEEAQKARTKAYEEAKAEGDNLGVYGEPSITNYEVSAQIIRQIEENKVVLSLGDLGEIVKKVAPGLQFEVPEELAEYVPLEILRKEEKNEKEKDALAVYQLLSQSYNRGSALRVAQSGYFTDLNQAAEQISEKYNSQEEE